MSNDFSILKERVNMADYITGRTGGKVRQAGSDTFNLSSCPFCGGHDCFRITPSEQSFHCFQCPTGETGGDVFDFIQRLDGCDKTEALRIMAEHQGYKLAEKTPDKVRRPPEEEKALQDRRDIFEEAASYYQGLLFNTPNAIGYQKKVRRHTDATLQAFRVGYADGRLYEHLKNKGYSDEQLIESGMVRLKDGRLYDFFGADLFIYPHMDKKQRVAGFTIKDQKKKRNYRLPGEHWKEDCLFYNMQAFSGDKVFLVEGENDLLSVFGRGELPHVAAINGQISREQLDYLVDWAPGKILYLCFDNDKSGQAYTEKVCKALEKLCLPDTLAKLFQQTAAEVRLIQFDQDVKDIDEHLKRQDCPLSSLENMVKGAERYFPPLRGLKELYSTWANDAGPDNGRKFDFDTYGKICFEWFQARGKFFIDGENCYLYHHNRIYQIGNNTPFKALLYDQACINSAINGARLVMQNIESQAYLRGDHTSIPGWIFTNFKENTVYFNLCGEFNNLLKIGPGKIETVPNGTNADSVLLRSSPKMHPLRYIHDADIKKGMEALKTHVFDNLACDLADRYFILCLIFNVVLLQYIKARGITKFSGTKGCGKTSAASIISAIIYGEDCVTSGSAASDFSEAAVSPLTISDNLESDAVRGGKRDFLLTAATGITRQKRKAGSDSDNVYERSCTQVLVTSIEPFAEPELIERTNEILFDKKFHNPDFKESVAVETDLKKSRDLIWSSIFKIISINILPDIEQKKADALKIIRKDYPNHSKARLNELYAILYLILEEVVKYISQTGYENDPAEPRLIFREWILAQNQRSFANEAETNKILYALEALVKEYELRPENFARDYQIEADFTRHDSGETKEIKFTASTGALYRAFDWLAKDRGIANPFKSPSQLGARITDSLEVLNKAGWIFKHHATASRGERKHHFIKQFNG